jgi:hypothetical protein
MSGDGVGVVAREMQESSMPLVGEALDHIDALTRVANGGSALDPEVVTRLVAANRRE